MKSKFTVIVMFLYLFCNPFYAQQSDYHIQPVPFTSINVADSFWMPKIKTIHEVTIPHALKMSKTRISNFRRAAKLETGGFASQYPFDDSDIFKIIEAASYSLYYFPDAEMEKTIDSLITIIGLAQEPDGYLYTCRTLNSFPNNWSGQRRWEKEYDLSHETYNMGHLFESACAYYQATGKDKYLKIAIKAADLLDASFGVNHPTTYPQYPGHQIVEVGLARLYRITGNEKYLNLAKFFLDVRGPGGEEYCQAHKKVVDQDKAVGHAVRAVYMYAGMADIAALKNEPAYITAIDKIWDDIVQTKLYVTGGIGASGGNEGFNGAYNLPNESAYCETCASVGNIYLNHRLFLLHGDAKYIDVLERTLYNALLSGISLSGDRFFYPNKLLSTGSTVRSEWFGCACCPPNIARLIPSVPGYIYAHTADSLYVNLYLSDTALFDFNGNKIEMVQSSNFPWSGNVELSVNPETEKEFTLLLRIPGWARNEAVPGNIYSFEGALPENASLSLNGSNVEIDLKKGYAILKRTWKKGDKITLNLPMPTRTLTANSAIIDDRERVSVQRGPLVFCAEGVDNGGSVVSMNYDTKNLNLTTNFDSKLLGGTQVVGTKSIKRDGTFNRDVKLIPYYLWSNRGASEMQIWLSVKEPVLLPDSLIVIDNTVGDVAQTNYVSSWESLASVYDLFEPATSADKGPGAFGNWTSSGTTINKWNWIRYDFNSEYKIGFSEVYWWNDGGGIGFPDSSFISYFDKGLNKWNTLPTTIGTRLNGKIAANTYNKFVFPPTLTDKIQLNFKGLSKAQGVLEWKVYKTDRLINGLHLVVEDIVDVYSNPAQDVLHVRLKNPSENMEISIFTLQGQLVYKNASKGTLSISKSEIGSTGVYLMRLISGDNLCSYHKVLFR